MTQNQKSCISCHKRITNLSGTVQFKCPNCDKYEIIRCEHCRKVASKYKCAECGFEGPN